MPLIDVRLEASEGVLDLVVEDGDLAHEETLETAILISLFTDTLAPADAPLPDAGSDRRGWWGSELLEAERGEPVGSLLWLLERAKLTSATLGRAEQYARDALLWLVREDLAERVDVVASRLDQQTLAIAVSIVRGRARARPDAWVAFASRDRQVGPLRFQLVAVP